MSELSFAADLVRAARKARGKQAHLTRKSREQALARLAAFLWRAGYQIHTTGQLKEKHVRKWAQHLAGAGRSKRTVANCLAHVRTALEGIDRRPFADKLSNTELGANGASRAGTKRPMTASEFERFHAAGLAVDPGIAIVLELQREFGLRAAEATRCVPSLADWRRSLTNPLANGAVTIIHGTKGGKTRHSPPLNRQRAIDVVDRAIEYARSHNGRLVRKSDLKRAMARYHFVVRKVGMVGESAPHGLRYAYATSHLQRLKAAGASRSEAAAGVSTWLGHGDGRGTWVARVYGRSELAGAEA